MYLDIFVYFVFVLMVYVVFLELCIYRVLFFVLKILLLVCRKFSLRISGWWNDLKIWNLWGMIGLLNDIGRVMVLRLVCCLLLIVIVFLMLDGFSLLGFRLSFGKRWVFK